jgi:hypothetical protein
MASPDFVGRLLSVRLLRAVSLLAKVLVKIRKDIPRLHSARSAVVSSRHALTDLVCSALLRLRSDLLGNLFGHALASYSHCQI